MSEDAEKETTPFLRQRRNLIVGSLIVLFVETTVSPPENIPLLGVTLKITHSDYIVYWLWLFTTYWLLRFFQHTPRWESICGEVAGYFDVYLSKLVAPVASRKFLKNAPDSPTHNYVSWTHLTIRRRLKLFQIGYSFGTVSSRYKDTGLTSSASGLAQGSAEINGLRAFYMNVHAVLDICIRTPMFTEYVVPLLLFVAAVMSSMHRIF